MVGRKVLWASVSRTSCSTGRTSVGPGVWRSLSSPPPRAIVFPGQWTSFFASRTEALKLERTSDYLGVGKAFDNADFQAPEVLVQSI